MSVTVSDEDDVEERRAILLVADCDCTAVSVAVNVHDGDAVPLGESESDRVIVRVAPLRDNA